jgi:hypothetical protein
MFLEQESFLSSLKENKAFAGFFLPWPTSRSQLDTTEHRRGMGEDPVGLL